MAGLTFVGPFLTRAQFARRAGIPTTQVALRPDLLRIRGPVQEAYFAFQLDRRGIRPELGYVVRSLKERHDDLVIADWLVRPNPYLRMDTPLACVGGGWGAEEILMAAKEAGPGMRHRSAREAAA